MATPKEKPKEGNEKAPAEFQRYAFANVAATMAQSEKDHGYLSGAISLLEKNLDFGRDGKDLYDQYVADEAVDKLIDIYNKKYNSKLAEATVSDVYDWLKPALDGATDAQKALIGSAFNKFGGENYAKLMGKIQGIQYKLKAPGIKPEDAEAVKKELSKYNGFILAYNALSNYNFEGLRTQAVKESKKFAFKGLEEVLLKEQPKEKEVGK